MRNNLQWLNPLIWTRAFSEFCWCWAASTPFVKLGAAAPAILALAAVTIVIALTYASDSSWRRGLVLDQIRIAKQNGSNGEVELLARRLLMETPDDLGLRFEIAMAQMGGDDAEQATQAIQRLALQDEYGKAALWLLEHEFSPIQWDQWNATKRRDFGKLLHTAANEQPNNQAIASIYADFLLLTGAPEKALGEITKLVSTQPARALQGAMILRESGRESQASTMARDGLALLARQGIEEPNNVDLALLQAQFALFLKRYDNAVDILNKTAKVADDARLRSGMAEVLVLWSRDQNSIANPTERFASQLSLLAKAVEVAPNHPLVVNDLMAVILQCADHTDPKVSQLRDLLVQGIAPELSHFVRGTSAMLRDDVDDASLHLELAAKSLPTVPAVLNNLAVVLATKSEPELDRASKLVDAALKQVPNHPYFHETKAQILREQEQYADAIIHFESALSAEPLREQVHEGLSECYAALGQKEFAQQHSRIVATLRKSQNSPGTVDDVKVNFSKKTAETPRDP